MRFWKRQASLNIGGRIYELGKFSFSFTVKAEDNEKLPTAEIDALNLSKGTRASISKGDPVILNAGYQGDVGAIFVGEVTSTAQGWSDVDVSLKIYALATAGAWSEKSVSKTYMPGMPASGILDDLLNIFGLEVSKRDLAVDRSYPRGKVCAGKMKDVLRDIVVNDCESRLMIKNGFVVINRPGSGSDSGNTLSAATGLLKGKGGKAEKAPDTGTAQEPQSIHRDLLLNHRLGVNDICGITDRELNGMYRIVSLQHQGSWRGSYQTSIEVVPA
jgi:hypothetical protein